MSRRKSVTLEQLRSARGMTQQDLGDTLGCTQGTISLWEKGKRCPSLKKASRIAMIFDTPIENIKFASK